MANGICQTTEWIGDGRSLADFEAECASRDAVAVEKAKALIGRTVMGLCSDDITKFADVAKSPAIVLVAEAGVLVAAYQSRITALQGACGLISRGRVAWFKVGANPHLTSFAVRAWATDIGVEKETAHDARALAVSSSIQGKHVGEICEIDIQILQEYAMATGYIATEIEVNASGHVTGVFEANGKPYEVEGHKWGVSFGAGSKPGDAIAVLVLHYFGEFLDSESKK